MSFAGMRQHFRQLPIVIARSMLFLSDARFRICRTPVPVYLGCPFVHLWTPIRAFVGCPYPYLCIRALGGNFIMTCTIRSIGTAKSHMLIAIGVHVRLLSSNIKITWYITTHFYSTCFVRAVMHDTTAVAYVVRMRNGN